DLVSAADGDSGAPLQALRVDGGMAGNAWFLQRQADLLGRPVLPSREKEATALGAAFLAGLQAGVWPDLDALRRLAHSTAPIEPRRDEAWRRGKLDAWHRAVHAVVQFYA